MIVQQLHILTKFRPPPPQEYLRSGTPGQPNVAGPQSQIINDDIPDDVLHEASIGTESSVNTS